MPFLLVYIAPGAITWLAQYLLCLFTKKRILQLIPTLPMVFLVLFPFFYWNKGLVYYVFRYISWRMLISAIIGDVIGWRMAKHDRH